MAKAKLQTEPKNQRVSHKQNAQDTANLNVQGGARIKPKPRDLKREGRDRAVDAFAKVGGEASQKRKGPEIGI